MGGLLFTLFFYRLHLGISVPLFLLIVAAGVLGVHVERRTKISRKNLWLLAPIVMGALAFVFYDSTFHLLLNLALIFLFSLLWAHFFTGGNPADQSLWNHLFILPHVISGQIEKPFPVVQEEFNVEAWRQRFRQYLVPTVRGIALALPLVVVFVVLMYSADFYFAQLLGELMTIEIDFDVAWWMRTTLLTIVSGWLLAGWVMYAAQPYHKRDTKLPHQLLLKVCRRVRPGPIESITMLTVLTIPSTIFVLVQFAFLFDGITPIAVKDYSYAEYARRGFFELILMAVLALTVILVLRKTTRFLNPKGSRTFRLLSTFFIGSTMVSLLSAFKRMNLYEQSFGFTETRLYVLIGIVWLGFLLGWFLISLWINPQRFALGTLIATIGFVGTLNLIQPEPIIVNRNFDRYGVTGELDVVYLTTLSSDATPALTQHLDQMKVTPVTLCRKTRPSTDGSGRSICIAPPDFHYLHDHLKQRQRDLEPEPGWRSWLSTHIGRTRARRALHAYFSSQTDEAAAR